MRIEVARYTHGRILIDDAEVLAERFFSSDRSSISPTGFDARAALPASACVTAEDVQAIWSTMRIRGSRAPLDDLVPLGDIPEIEAMRDDWELMTLDDDVWRNQAVPAIRAALERLNPIHGMGPAIMTKVLGLKRPRLVPLCDSYVLELLGVAVPTERERRPRRPERLIAAIQLLRAQGQANLETLQAIQRRLACADYERTLARILDALLWSVHPASDYSHTGAFDIRWSA